MCGRFTLVTEKNHLKQRFSIENMEQLRFDFSYNVAPSQQVLAVVDNGEERKGGYLRWGLVPSWAKDASLSHKMINARSETVHVKPSFKTLLQRRRCLILADGFYEWKKVAGKKQPYRIKMRNNEPFAFAGLWDRWEKDGELLVTCTILTTTPNALMKDIHERMPVILDKEKEQLWLNRSQTNPEILKDVFVPYPAQSMEAYQVSSLVNSPKNNTLDCIKPVG